MKTSSWGLCTRIFAAILVIAPMSVALQAQERPEKVLVDIPFAFEAGTSHLPSGRYTIQLATDHALCIRGMVHSGFALSTTQNEFPVNKIGKVIFRKYGNRYFMREVWPQGQQSHLELFVSKAEKRVNVGRVIPAGPQQVELAQLENTR